MMSMGLINMGGHNEWRFLLVTGVTQLVNYNREVKRLYKPQKLGLAFPRLYDVAYAETVASAFLQVMRLLCLAVSPTTLCILSFG